MLVSRSAAQEEAVKRHNTYDGNNELVPGMYEVPVSLTEIQYDSVVEHSIVGPVMENPTALFPVYEGVGYGGSSAASSMFYQYVPSTVRTS